MPLLTGTKVSPDSFSCPTADVIQTCVDQFGNVRQQCPQNQQATFLRVPTDKKFQLTSLETKIRSTGNAEVIKLMVDGSEIRRVHFSSLDSSFVSSSVNGLILLAGARVYFERESFGLPCKSFNASCDFKIGFEEITPPPPPLECGPNSHEENGVCICDTGFHLENDFCVADPPPPDPDPDPEPEPECDPGFHLENNVCVPDVPEPEPEPEPPPEPDEGLTTNQKIAIGLAVLGTAGGIFAAMKLR